LTFRYTLWEKVLCMAELALFGAVLVNLCLTGSAFFWLSSKLSSLQSKASSEVIQEAISSQKRWRAEAEASLENLYDKVNRKVGRLYRLQRTEGANSDEATETPQGASQYLDGDEFPR